MSSEFNEGYRVRGKGDMGFVTDNRSGTVVEIYEHEGTGEEVLVISFDDEPHGNQHNVCARLVDRIR